MRTQILASLLIIGLVGAIAGGSTLAIFSDTEASQNNTFTAGALDLKVDWNESYNGEPVETQNLTDNPGPIFEINDVKPGDEGEATVSFHLYDNPGWIWMNVTQTMNLENGCTEPESDVDETCDSPGPDQGELGEHLQFTVWYDDGDNVLEDGETVFIENQTADQIDGGSYLLDADPTTGAVDAFDNSTTRYIGIMWNVPLSTGNEVQTDSKMLDFTFYAEQERHNPQAET